MSPGVRRTIVGFFSLLAMLCHGCSGGDHASSPPFIAFSLREASLQAKSGNHEPELLGLGGINRIVGMIYDSEGKDIILVGFASPELPPARLDDLVVALRARICYGEFPLVSIDPVTDTEGAKLQQVRFDGHLEDTAFGKEFLQCDILLKRYTLQQVKDIPGVPSYNALVADDIREETEQDGVRVTDLRWCDAAEGAQIIQSSHGSRVESSEEPYQARFWFRGQEKFKVACKPDEFHPEAFCIKELKIIVRSESLQDNAQRSKHPARERFERAWTEHFDALCRQYAELKKLKLIYDLVAVADVVRAVQNVEKQPYLAHLLEDYEVAREPTPRTYELVELYGVVARSDGMQRLVRISGGIELRPDVRLLNHGDVTQLRGIVLGSRPSARSLAWRLPLDGWNVPNAGDLGLPDDGGKKLRQKAGCSVLSQSVLLNPQMAADDNSRRFGGFGPPPQPPPPLRGVSMRMVVTEDSFEADVSGELQGQANDLIKSRPSPRTLSWPASKK
jgi:hypothetical protein